MKRKRSKNYGAIFMTVFIAFIMVTSVIGYIMMDSSTNIKRYNGHKFTLTNQGWKLDLEGKTFYFSYLPADLEYIEFPEEHGLRDILQIDTTYDFNSSFREDIAASIFELNNILTEDNVFSRTGFTDDSPDSLNSITITCSEASPYLPILYYKETDETEFSFEGNCIIIGSRDKNGFLALTDRIAYEILGIM